MRNILIGTALAVCLAAPAAADYDKGPYVGIEGGVWLPHDFRINGILSIEGGGDEFHGDR